MKVLFVCSGNTCRSPMAKVIFEQILKRRGLGGRIIVDSAAKNGGGGLAANSKARDAIKLLYDGLDLLANHKSKSIDSVDISSFDLILTMEKHMKRNFPLEKTYTLKEYAVLEGKETDIDDPMYKGTLETYISCRDEIKDCLERIVELKTKELRPMFLP